MEVQDLLFDPILAPKNMKTPGEPVEKFCERAFESFANFGFDLRISEKLEELMRQVGFQDVTRKDYYIPVGRMWKDSTQKRRGAYMQEYLKQMADGLLTKSSQNEPGFSEEERLSLTGQFKRELTRTKGLCFKYGVVYGRKV